MSSKAPIAMAKPILSLFGSPHIGIEKTPNAMKAIQFNAIRDQWHIRCRSSGPFPLGCIGLIRRSVLKTTLDYCRADLHNFRLAIGPMDVCVIELRPTEFGNC
jgi:hypothetical protein